MKPILVTALLAELFDGHLLHWWLLVGSSVEGQVGGMLSVLSGM